MTQDQLDAMLILLGDQDRQYRASRRKFWTAMGFSALLTACLLWWLV